MVGTPRSSGCATCLKRKKKCGQERPACEACIKSGWSCPGYRKTWKFVHENDHLALSYRKKRFTFEEPEPEGTIPVPTNLEKPSLLQSTANVSTETSMIQQARHTPYHVMRPLQSDSDRSGSLLSYILSSPDSASLLALKTIGDFVSYIPSRLGKNMALDKSIACLCSIYVDTMTRNGIISNATLGSYSNTLHSLQRCLDHFQIRPESETVCASIIIQLCELYIDSGNRRWSSLSKGTELLIRACGPARYSSGFERAMLESQRAMFITQAMHNGESSFLAAREWRGLPKLTVANPASPAGRNVRLRAELCEYLVDIPRMVFKSSKLSITAKDPSNYIVGRPMTANLRVQVAKMKSDLEAWLVREVEPGLYKSHALDVGGAPEYEGRDQCADYSGPGLLAPITDCVANTVLMMLDRLELFLQSLEGVQVPGATFCPEKYLQRQLRAKTAYAYVKMKSVACAKPLEAGLQQISAQDDILKSLLT